MEKLQIAGNTNEAQISVISAQYECLHLGFAHFSAVIAKSGKSIFTFAPRSAYVTLNVSRVLLTTTSAAKSDIGTYFTIDSGRCM